MLRKTGLTTLLAMLLATQGALAVSVVDFEAIALRPANDTTAVPMFSVANELIGQNGMHAETFYAGQKSMYGTRALNGVSLSRVLELRYKYFTFEETFQGSGEYKQANPAYSNFAVSGTDGTNAFTGILSGSKAASYSNFGWGNIPVEIRQAIKSKYFPNAQVSDSLKQLNGREAVIDIDGTDVLDFYEPSNPDAPAHWSNVASSTFDSFVLTGSRAMSVSGDYNTWPGYAEPYMNRTWIGETDAKIWRGPHEHGISVLWGDSLANYLGSAYVWDVQVTYLDEDDEEQILVAGPQQVVPEPMTMLAFGSAVAGIGGYIRRRRS